jgi:hypothetical protein
MNQTPRENSNLVNEADQTLNCRDCKQPFVFTEGEQRFFAEKGFNPPARCKGCRELRKVERGGPPQTISTALPEVPETSGRGGGGYGGQGKGGGGGKRRRERTNWNDE